MHLNFQRKFLAVWAGVFLAIHVWGSDTNQAGMSREEAIGNFLQLQEQLHATQLALQQNQLAATETFKSNTDLLTARLQTLELAVAAQRNIDINTAHKTQEFTLLIAGIFGLAALGIMALMVFLQTRSFTQLAKISAQQQAAIAGGQAIHQLAAPGRATVETANAQLMNAVGQLTERLSELENNPQTLPQTPNGKGHAASGNGRLAMEKNSQGVLAEGQKYLDENAPQKALDFFDKFLAAHPDHTEALLKKADALEKLDRTEEALAHYNRVIAANNTLAIAHLHKGGLLNRLRRYDEALNCYEQALQAQEKKIPTAK